MDGLNCREITLKEAFANKDKRIDSQFWTTHIFKNPRYTYSKIGKAILSSQYGMSIDMNTEKKGYPIFRMNELHHMMTDLEVEKYADVSSIEYQAFSLQNRDVLFNRTNSYEWVGRTGIYYKNDDTPFTYASYLVKFVPDSSVILPEYLTAFLNTGIGVKAIKARARQSVNQTNVNPEEVKEIEIPLLSMRFQKAIEKLFLIANEERVCARNLYEQAVHALHDYLDVKLEPNCNPYSEKLLSASFGVRGRFDAEYYHPKYERYEKTIKESKHGFTLIKYKFELISDKCDRTLHQYKYVEIGDINIGTGVATPNVVMTEDLPDNAKIMTKVDDILVSTVRPNRGAVSILTQNDLLVSGAFTVLRETSDYPKEVLQLLLRSEMYRDWMLKYNVGTSYPVIKDNDVLNLPIPILGKSEKETIVKNVRKSSDLRDVSKHLLDLAVKTVEMAIEQNEDAALAWLKANVPNLEV